MNEKMSRDNQKIVQRIVNHLLSCDMVAEDVRRKVFKSTKDISLTEALGKIEDTVFFIEGKSFSREHMALYCEHVDAATEEYPITLAKRVSLSDIESDLKKYEGKAWRDLSYKEQLEVLWCYGLNVKAGNPEASKYWVTRCTHRNRANKAVQGLCIVASERVDKEWTSTPMASYEAKVYTTDGSLANDLASMCRY